MIVAGREAHAVQAAFLQPHQVVFPTAGALAVGQLDGEHVPAAVPADAEGNGDRTAVADAAFAHAFVTGKQLRRETPLPVLRHAQLQLAPARHQRTRVMARCDSRAGRPCARFCRPAALGPSPLPALPAGAFASATSPRRPPSGRAAVLVSSGGSLHRSASRESWSFLLRVIVGSSPKHLPRSAFLLNSPETTQNSCGAVLPAVAMAGSRH